MEKQKLVEKLKKVKDPIERDRLMREIAGCEDIGKFGEFTKKENLKADDRPPPQEERQAIPQLPINVREMLAYVVPGFLIFFGLINLAQALGRILPTGRYEDAMPQLIVSGALLLFGITGIFSARKKIRDMKREEAGSGESKK